MPVLAFNGKLAQHFPVEVMSIPAQVLATIFMPVRHHPALDMDAVNDVIMSRRAVRMAMDQAGITVRPQEVTADSAPVHELVGELAGLGLLGSSATFAPLMNRTGWLYLAALWTTALASTLIARMAPAGRWCSPA